MYDSFSTNHPIAWAILFALTLIATCVAPMIILKPQNALTERTQTR